MQEYYLRVMDTESGYTQMWRVWANSELEAIDHIENKFDNKEVVED
jgi:hypothetical protein